MRSSAAASLCIHEKPIRTLFRYPAGGGNHHRRPSSSSRRSPWRGGSSSPSGLKVCTSRYVLYLSRVLKMEWSWCNADFVDIDDHMEFFPSLSSWWIGFSPLKFYYQNESLRIWENLIYVLHMNTCGDNGVLYWFTWYVFWHSTRGFPRWHWGNLCIGVDAYSRLCFFGRNLGALFEVIRTYRNMNPNNN